MSFSAKIPDCVAANDAAYRAWLETRSLEDGILSDYELQVFLANRVYEQERAIKAHRELMAALVPCVRDCGGIGRRVMAVLQPGFPMHLDHLQAELNCTRDELHKALAYLKRGGRVQNAGVGLWQRCRMMPTRHAFGELGAKVLSQLNGHPVSTNEVAVAIGQPRQNVYHSLCALTRRGDARRSPDGRWLLSEEMAATSERVTAHHEFH
jgi:hypothetical protein